MQPNSNFLQYNEYPLLRQEVGLIAGSLVLLAAFIGLVYAAADRPGRIALQILLVSLAFDLNFDGWVVGIGTAATIILLNRHIMPFTGIVAAVVLASAAAGSAFDTGSNSESTIPAVAQASGAPPLLHLILDEHIGVEGLVGDAPEPTAIRQELTDFYVRKGFRLFGGAYSEYLHTVNSIPQVLNFGTEQQWPQASPIGMTISNNAYFDRLGELGYRIAVYQTDFMKFCSDGQTDHCRQYRQQDFAAIDDTELSAGEKARLLTYGFAYLSRFTRVAAGLFDYASEKLFHGHADRPRLALASRRRIDPIGATTIIDQLTHDLRNARSGEAFFAHLIIPHDPYAFRADCSIKPASDWLVRLSSDATRDETEQAYFDQITCLNKKLEGVFQALLSSKAGKDAIIIVHGDHGYRDAWPEP
ncbi:MAG: hypothetical protein K0R53_3413, partial [Burkholderiales bacterium]|nr:hypothetical protein [Burkholderiales bacterium]